MNITNIIARQILDSRGNPTIEVDVWLDSGVFGRAAAPSGASTGVHEAHELRDGDHAYNGQGVLKAVANVEQKIKDALLGLPADDQFLIDNKMRELDGTENKSNLGANAILAVSLAVAHAAAKERNILLYAHINDIAGNPNMNLPMPMMNVLNGGKHALNSSDFQEFMLIPKSAKSYAQAVQMGSEIFQSLKKVLKDNGLSTAVGDEGGFTYPIESANTEMLDLLELAVKEAGYKSGEDIGYALDVAASEFYDQGAYSLGGENKTLQAEEMISYLENITNSYPILSIEDGLAEDDWSGWRTLTERIGRIQLVGDDLLVTNQMRLQKAIDEQAGNSILIKPNQIGTLTETIEAISLAKASNWRTIVSHRSGETEDITIAHIAIGTGSGQIKTGSLSRGERTAKHNELMRLETIDKELKLENPF